MPGQRHIIAARTTTAGSCVQTREVLPQTKLLVRALNAVDTQGSTTHRRSTPWADMWLRPLNSLVSGSIRLGLTIRCALTASKMRPSRTSNDRFATSSCGRMGGNLGHPINHLDARRASRTLWKTKVPVKPRQLQYLLGSHEIVFVGIGRRGSSRGKTQLRENVAYVTRDRLLADHQLSCNCAIRLTSGN